MTPGFLKGKRVLIRPINELGTVISHHSDSDDEPVIVVIRDSDGQRHCCRMFELVPQLDDGALFQQYCEVYSALELVVPGYREALNHHCGSMLTDERDAAITILKLCEETLNKYSVKPDTVEAVGE